MLEPEDEGHDGGMGPSGGQSAFVRELRIRGYRSVRDLRLQPANLTVVTGPNGTGKTNLYRGLYLLHAAAVGELSATLAQEGACLPASGQDLDGRTRRHG